MRRLKLLVWAGIVTLAGGGGFAMAADQPADAPSATLPGVDFSREIRPILSDNCFQCHGPDEKARKADLRLDTREGATAMLEGGYAAVKPGDPDASELIKRINHPDPDERMPKRESGKSLTEEQKQKLRAWIEQGAEWETHWAFMPVRDVAPAQVKDEAWVRNPIDSFILARLEAAGIKPSPEADKPTLIRRVYLDLIGLPPTPAEVDAFVQSAKGGPHAYRELVEKLLASEHYGERWGRHWLDGARYADSNGYSIDSPRPIWPYRDWVIKALNDDMPFDQFTIEQIAGDLLPGATQSQIVATGFHRNTLVNQEGGSDPEQYRNEAIVDRVNTTGSVWLGLTLGCAQCHTHKFDPILHKEYYQFFAFFNSDADRNSIEPTIRIASEKQKQELKSLETQLASAKKKLADYDSVAAKENQAWEKKLLAEWKPTQWHTVEPEAFKAQSGVELRKLEDKSLLAGGKNPDEEMYRVTGPSPLKKVTAVRVETLTHESLPRKGPGRAANGNFVLHEFRLINSGGGSSRFEKAFADHSQKDYEVIKAIDGQLDTGWAINTTPPDRGNNVNRTAVFVLDRPLSFRVVEPLTFELQSTPGPRGYAIGRFRISVTDAEDPNLGDVDPLIAAVRTEPAKRSEAQKKLIAERSRGADAERVPLVAAVEKIEAEIKKLNGAMPQTMVMRRLPEPRPSFIHVRGDFLRHGEPVKPGTPAVLNPFEADPDTATRLDLAKWLVDKDNPLTPRVTVNRIWMHYFGQGLVETENDFGMQGTPPTHPDLLDWLAGEFMRGGWSMKHIHRLIVNSATYRQASDVREDLAEIDPNNKLLARQSRIRVEAEIVRDLALASSGLLTETVGGPSVYPPQPDGVYAFSQSKQRWATDTGPDRYRRGMYTFIFRAAPYPMLGTFDVPSPNVTCTRRARSNTPLQALTMANSEATFEMAQGLARRVLGEQHANEASRMRRAFRLCLGREPQTAEMQRLLTFLAAQQSEFAADPSAAAQVAPKDMPKQIDGARAAAWVATSRVLMNLDEFLTRE